ncbi:MAG: hypothetical protein IBJ16_03500 [Chitinophagaceae bacterium]|nr:hypothetical protein [Chitinophagaceae bacterium]
MKKTLIGSVVGAIILFLWQFVSWTAAELHRPAQAYTPNQDTILQFLETQLPEEGSYFLPGFPDGTSMEEQEKLTEAAVGKPWAQIAYHKSMDMNMGVNMGRGLAINIVILLIVCWIFKQMGSPSFATILSASLCIGLIGFFNISYTNHIWFQTRDLMANLIDAIVGWGLTGLWLGWWLRRN